MHSFSAVLLMSDCNISRAGSLFNKIATGGPKPHPCKFAIIDRYVPSAVQVMSDSNIPLIGSLMPNVTSSVAKRHNLSGSTGYTLEVVIHYDIDHGLQNKDSAKCPTATFPELLPSCQRCCQNDI